MMKCWYSGNCHLENESCKDNCIRYKNIQTLLVNSNLPTTLWNINPIIVDSIDMQAFKAVAQIGKNISKFVKEGKCLYLWSTNTGNGKTTWASRLMLAYFNEIWVYSQLKCRGIYIYIPNLINSLKTQYLTGFSNSELLDNIKNANLVIFDDLGCGKLSDNDINNLLDLIDYRLNNNKSCIFTSNLSKQELSNLLGKRLTSRIYNSSLVLELRGVDKRGVCND